MGGHTVISPTARGWRIRRRWRGPFPPDTTPIHALVHRRWLVEATCLAIPPSATSARCTGLRPRVAAPSRIRREWAAPASSRLGDAVTCALPGIGKNWATFKDAGTQRAHTLAHGRT
jgi:hypothetical protein